MLRSFIASHSLQPFKSTMSSPRFNARGRGRWSRGFCHRPPWDGGGGGGHPFVSGDSHLDAVRDANYGYRRGHGGDYPISRGNPGQDPQPRPQFRPNPRAPPFHPNPQAQPFHPHPHPPQFRPHPRPQFRPHPYPHPPQRRPDDHRNWVYAVNQPPSQCERFTVLSYNILADYLARDHRARLYFHIPHHILDWEWRKKKLFLEFGLWSPDIMCLQEVDRFHDLEEELAIRGYAGIWKMRTGNAVDGCAIFWRTTRFQLCHEEHIEFNKLGLRDNVAQICVLQSRKQDPAANSAMSSHDSYGLSSGVNQIVICNIHVLYNPRRGELKLGQVRSLLDRAYAVSRTWNDAPVIVCGDFNSTPKSPMYKFISEQKLNLSGLARNQISGQYADSIHASWPHFGSGYRPQFSRSNHTGPKDVEQGNNFKASDSHHKPQNDTDNSSQNERLPSPDKSNGVSSGKLLSYSNELSDSNETEEVGTAGSRLGDDTLCLSRLVDPSHHQDERCGGCSELHFKINNCWNQDVTSAGSSKNEHNSGEFQLDHGKNSSTSEAALFIRSSPSECPQLNERVTDELIRHDVDSTFDSELCQELKDLYHQEKDVGEFDPEVSVAPTTHEASTDHDTLKVDMNAIQGPPVEASQLDASPEKPLFHEGLLDRKHMNNFGISISSLDISLGTSPANDKVSNMDLSSASTTKEKVDTDSSFQDTCTTNQPNSSNYGSSLNEVDRIRVEDLLLDDDCLNTDSTKIMPCTEENTTPDITDHNIYIDLNSEESNRFPEKSVLASGSYREPLADHNSSQNDGLINETSTSKENSDPNFFKELLGTDDAEDHIDMNGENKISLSPVHTSGNAETSGNTSDPTYAHDADLDTPADRIHDVSPHHVDVPPANMEYSYNPYLWTPMEVEAASGNADCSLVEHRLKLRSAYTDVEDCAGTKDSSREPEVTSYHRLFMGTVDYIWYSDGLQTVKVLDTIPKHVLLRTAGFPTRKWGSDHLALVCEVAFTKGVEPTK